MSNSLTEARAVSLQKERRLRELGDLRGSVESQKWS